MNPDPMVYWRDSHARLTSLFWSLRASIAKHELHDVRLPSNALPENPVMLHRYWIQFTQVSQPSILNTGCGVTAYSEDDARELVCELVFPTFGEREITHIIADVDISTLDQGHVIPNMTSHFPRGVWFPRL